MKPVKTYEAIGLMSGTSGDGLDIAYCTFWKNDKWHFEIVQAETIAFPSKLAQKLRQSHLLSAEQLALLDVDFGAWMGTQVREFCEKHRLAPLTVCSHGHTVFHQPHLGMTKQIGSGWTLRENAGFPVINDFRSFDVALGGQGAPLAPVGDHLLFPDYEGCLNLGGISNISMVYKGQRIAFDVSPFNLLLNEIAARKGLAYDDRGMLAATGKVNTTFLEQLNAIDFYTSKNAKSLGREEIEGLFLPLLEKHNDSEENLLATLVEHYAVQISTVVQQFFPPANNRLLVTGGGAYHAFFIDQLQKKLGNETTVIVPEPSIVEFKEALIFAFLGVLRINNEINTLAAVTGASRDSCGGVYYP
ncbi:anhydro-N-acetylmuramic acid kinase [Echinicola vietnamensis]|uniref:Molecular chaperone n=1 Tax=Echinicola vietnamensis (strain DSM 17526 / LMG 23754 / KMM 6221) TaxID=926556 RepID=L0FV06_ECHVK|nr:anhydro-N-acetylmuramic acid kinase [Echinicola vietnamensis]AGA77132.1 molecular chaperone [Echinicola vietnamensis DSM 17526]